MDTDLRWVQAGCCGCIVRVVIATLPGSCAKGHGSGWIAAADGDGCGGTREARGMEAEPSSARHSVELCVRELRIIQQDVKS